MNLRTLLLNTLNEIGCSCRDYVLIFQFPLEGEVKIWHKIPH
jgi:hypothetical protein